ncbi:MAG: hypothetical protein ACE5G7_07255 [Candidatus Hydrothermarchaeaceae archaeon]
MRQTPKKNLEFLKKRGVSIKKKEEKGRPRRLSQEEVRRVLAVRKCDLSFYRTASLTGVPKSTVFDYCKRYSCDLVSEEDVEDVQLEEARALFSAMLEKDLDGEINQLALRGLQSESIVEMEGLLRRIDDIVQFHSP